METARATEEQGQTEPEVLCSCAPQTPSKWRAAVPSRPRRVQIKHYHRVQCCSQWWRSTWLWGDNLPLPRSQLPPPDSKALSHCHLFRRENSPCQKRRADKENLVLKDFQRLSDLMLLLGSSIQPTSSPERLWPGSPLDFMI